MRFEISQPSSLVIHQLVFYESEWNAVKYSTHNIDNLGEVFYLKRPSKEIWRDSKETEEKYSQDIFFIIIISQYLYYPELHV